HFVGGKGVATASGFGIALFLPAAVLGGAGAGAVFAVTRRFLPTLVVAIVGTLAGAMLLGEGAITLGIVVALFALTGVKRALDEQDYPTFEIIVLDDRSTDGTAATALARRDPRVRLVRGAELPEGWTGKNWACTQLAREARGDVLCFVDADTILQPETLSRASGELREGDFGLVSMLLRTDTGTVAEGA